MSRACVVMAGAFESVLSGAAACFVEMWTCL